MRERLTAKEVCDYLRISRWTLYRLIKSGTLLGFKIGRKWCFKPREVKAYHDYRTLIYPACLFHDTVLYKYSSQPQKYKITLKGRTGWIAPRPEYLNALSEAARACEGFKKIKYQKIRWRKTMAAIIVQPKYFARLPPVDQQEWLSFEILK